MRRIVSPKPGRAWIALPVVVLVAGCSREAAQSGTSDEPEAWRLSSPTLDIGVAEGDERLELSGASSSIRLEDGRVVIANSGTSELRVFDRQGQFQKTVGRRGEGPGEFTGALHAARLTDTSFAVFDQGNQRLSVFDTAGRVLGESRVNANGVTDFPLWVWLHDRSWIVGPVDTAGRSKVIAALDQLPDLPEGSYRYVHLATDGRIWSQQRDPAGGAPHPWEVFSPAGRALGTINLPPGDEVQQVGPDFILLRHWGVNDVEQIHLYPVPASGGGAPLAGKHETAPAPALSNTRETMATAIRNLVTAQEMFYADHGEYATDAAGLRWEIPEGTSLFLMEADKRGWVGLIVHRTLPVLCGMAVGGSTPPGWMEGSPKCSR